MICPRPGTDAHRALAAIVAAPDELDSEELAAMLCPNCGACSGEPVESDDG